MASMIESPLARLSDEQIEELGREFDAIHDEVFDSLGDRDRRYIVSMIEMHRRLVVMGRVLLLASRYRAPRIAGATLPYGCRIGICHTCVGTLCSGKVRDMRTGKVSGSEGEVIRTCVNAPEGPVEIAL